VDKLDANESRAYGFESTGWAIGGSRGACDVEEIDGLN
jgi:hypothetical protein